jgi:mono/diheme cytochrome c family protein
MSLRWLVAAGSLWVGAWIWQAPPFDSLRSLRVAPLVASLNAQDGAAAQQALVDTYCLTCHNDRAKTGGFTLEGLSLANAGAHPDVW